MARVYVVAEPESPFRRVPVIDAIAAGTPTLRRRPLQIFNHLLQIQ